MSRSVEDTFRLAIRQTFGGNFFCSTEESIAQYEVDSPPRDFKLLMCDSVLR